jgi:AraC-like DNA-binding protein
MDVLSDILDGLELRGSLYFSTAFSDPWSIDVPADTNVCRFHVIVQGPCRITVPETGDSATLSKGDLVLVPHGNGHWLQSSEEQPLKPLPEVLDEGWLTADGCLHWGGGGPATRMVCGYFAFDKETAHPLLASLPGLIPVKATASYDFSWIENLTRFIGQEAGSGRPGSDAISRRLSEVLFIQVLRHYAATTPDAVPVLAAIADPHLGPALRTMHGAPGEPWTVESLAREAALSRTAFAQKFHSLAGLTPMAYLTHLRMDRARHLLKGEQSTAAVGEAVGYQSEAAFHRAFKKAYGVGPGAYRRSLSS